MRTALNAACALAFNCIFTLPVGATLMGRADVSKWRASAGMTADVAEARPAAAPVWTQPAAAGGGLRACGAALLAAVAMQVEERSVQRPLSLPLLVVMTPS